MTMEIMQMNAPVSLETSAPTNDDAEFFTTSALMASAPKVRDPTKWLHKTKLCVYSVQGTCRLGSKCCFAHSATEVQETPNLHKTQICEAHLQGKCSNENCSFAHGDEELRLSPNFKNKLCKWFGKGKCRNGDECGFAHGADQLRKQAMSEVAVTAKSDVMGSPVTPPPPPGLSLSEPFVLDLETSLLDEKAPPSLEEQVEGMNATIAALQWKMDDMVLRTQVSGMKEYLGQLSAQCADLEQVLGQTTAAITTPAPTDIVANAPWKKTAAKTPLKTKLSSKANPFQPSVLSSKAQPFMPTAPSSLTYQTYETNWPFQECVHDTYWPSDDSTSIGSGGFSSD